MSERPYYVLCPETETGQHTGRGATCAKCGSLTGSSDSTVPKRAVGRMGLSGNLRVMPAEEEPRAVNVAETSTERQEERPEAEQLEEDLRTANEATLVLVERYARLERAARKIHDGPSHYPTHLGGCIGGLSDVHCPCGITDLHFAVMALDSDG